MMRLDERQEQTIRACARRLGLRAAEEGADLALRASEEGADLSLRASEEGADLALRASEEGATLALRGACEGVAVAIARVRRGTTTAPWPTVQFAAFAAAPFSGGPVVFRPNFLLCLPGPRRISDDIGVRGLLGFVHRDRMGDPLYDRRLVVHADDPVRARALLTAPAARSAVLAALEAAGHIRIEKDRVVLDVGARPRRGRAPFGTEDEVEALVRAAVRVVRALEPAPPRPRA